jgi:hypothetical protein
MAKNRKVKGFCGVCHDPVITGGKQYGNTWYHNPCYAFHTYGVKSNPETKVRRSAPTREEIMERSEEEMNPRESNLPEERMEILAHANNVTFAMVPPRKGIPQQYYIWQGARAAASNIVRFPQYGQANTYYKDVIDGKTGAAKGSSSGKKTKIILIVVGVIVAAGIIYYLYKRNKTVGNTIKHVAGKIAGTESVPKPPETFGGAP